MAVLAATMLTQEQAVEIRVTARRGVGIREIARELVCSRSTVRRYLKDPDAGRYRGRPPRQTRLDAYKAYLLERVAAAAPEWIPAAVLHRELRERGYAGGLAQVKAFFARHKQKAPDPVVRFETQPGRQMQADLTTIRRGRQRLLAFVATLGYSRATFVRFTEGEDCGALQACSGRRLPSLVYRREPPAVNRLTRLICGLNRVDQPLNRESPGRSIDRFDIGNSSSLRDSREVAPRPGEALRA